MKTNTNFLEMYFSIIPPFNENDSCYVSIYNHHNTLEANVFIRQHENIKINKSDTFYVPNHVWKVRRQGNRTYQTALYAVSKTEWTTDPTGAEGKYKINENNAIK